MLTRNGAAGARPETDCGSAANTPVMKDDAPERGAGAVANRLNPVFRRGPGIGSAPRVLALLALAPLALAVLTAPPVLGGTFDDLGIRIEQSYQRQDLRGLEDARTELLALAGTPSLAADAGYYAAYARFRQALVAEADRPAAAGYLEDCIAELGSLVSRSPGHAEARALLGSCQGMSTLYNAFATMVRGPEARRQLNEARRLAPDNPWVVMQDGLADWATPRLFGGDRERAVQKMERAARLFTDAMAAGSRLAPYGAAEIWRQLATRYESLGRETEARLALERASRLTGEDVQLAAR